MKKDIFHFEANVILILNGWEDLRLGIYLRAGEDFQCEDRPGGADEERPEVGADQVG